MISNIHTTYLKGEKAFNSKKFTEEMFNQEFQDIISIRPEKEEIYERARNLGIDWLNNYLDFNFDPLSYYQRNNY